MIDASKFYYIKSTDRKIFNIAEGKKKYIETGYVGFMCPNCLNIVNIGIASSNIIDNIAFIKDFCVNTSYHGECYNCKEYVEFKCIDINMVKTIQILNSKGYYTAFSCEGHIEPDNDTLMDTFRVPYIHFYLWEDSEILKDYPLPESWFMPDIYKSTNTFSIYDSIMEEIPKEISVIDDQDKFISWMHKNWDKEKRLKDIYNWAVSLPDRDDDLKKLSFKLAKKYNTCKSHDTF
jgi:hypothetical protein